MEEVSFESLPAEIQTLINSAEKAMQNSHSPYSRFKVGAAVLTSSGSIHCGTNVEDASLTVVHHAEAVALSTARTQGDGKIRSLAVIASRHTEPLENICAPCGNCRQEIFEFSQLGGVDIEVYMSNTKKTSIMRATISELLPLAFGPRDLGVQI